MPLQNYLYDMGFIVGGIFLAAGAFMYFFPPKGINGLVGYRTKSSMKSQERWDFAQVYSGKVMMFCGVGFALALYLLSYLKISETWINFVIPGSLIILAIILIFVVEIKLKKTFK